MLVIFNLFTQDVPLEIKKWVGEDSSKVILYSLEEFSPNIPSLYSLYLAVVPDYPDPPKLLLLIGRTKEGEWINLGKVKYNQPFNPAKSFVFCENNKVIISSEASFSTLKFIAEYQWDKKKGLILINETTEDPSLESLKKIDVFLNRGEIEKALKELELILYPEHYYNSCEMAVKFLRAAHKFALKAYRNKDVKKAVRLMEKVFEEEYLDYPFFYNVEEYHQSEWSEYMEIKEYVEILNNYAFFLGQDGRFKEAVDILRNVLEIAPGRVVAYLNIADALWEQKEKQEAIQNYKKYIELMRKRNKTHLVPSRVWERTGYGY